MVGTVAVLHVVRSSISRCRSSSSCSGRKSGHDVHVHTLKEDTQEDSGDATAASGEPLLDNPMTKTIVKSVQMYACMVKEGSELSLAILRSHFSVALSYTHITIMESHDVNVCEQIRSRVPVKKMEGKNWVTRGLPSCPRLGKIS